MSDLISKSALIDALKVHFDSCFREDGELLYSDHICTSDDVVDLINLVDNQPTSYNVDKVVNELKQAIQNGTIKIEVGNSKLFEIVKQDDISDDMCEWRKFNGNSCLFKTSCGNISGMYRGFNFCPYCGKKINEVKYEDENFVLHYDLGYEI